MALLSIPIIVYLHLLRRKPKRRLVSSTLFWRAKGELYSTGRKKRPFYHSLSFWLEIAAAVLLSVLLAIPSGCQETGSHHILIIDTSASMKVSPLGEKRFWEEYLRRQPNSDRFTIIGAGTSPRLLAGPKTTTTEGLAAVRDLPLSSPSGNIQAAISTANNFPSGTITVFTDHPPQDEIAVDVNWIAEGLAKQNMGLITANREQNEVKIGIWNASENEGKALLALKYSQKREEKELILKPQETRYLDIILPDGTELLELELLPQQEDGLTADNMLRLYPEKPRELRVAVDLHERTAQILGLGLNADSPLLAISANLRPARPLTADILFTDRNIGGSVDTWRVSILPPQGDTTVAHRRLFIRPSHPLLYNLNLQNVHWGYSQARKLRGLPLIETEKQALFSEEIIEGGQRRIFHFNLIPSLSSLHQTPAWPILLAAILEKRRAELPGLIASNLQSEEDIVINDPPEGDWRIQTPSQQIPLVYTDGNIHFETKELGLYRIFTEQESHSVAVNLLSREETNRSVQGNYKQSASISDSLDYRSNAQISIALLLLLLCLLNWNWRIT